MIERSLPTSPAHDRPETDNASTIRRIDGLSILLIDDNPAVARAIEIACRIAGHRVTAVTSPQDAYSALAGARHDAILLDMNFTPGRSNGEEGLACLARIVGDDPAACVVVITAHSGIRIAVAAMQAGARDFVMKPWRNADLIGKIEAAVGRQAARVPAGPAAAITSAPDRLLGESAAIQRLRDLVRRIGPTSASVTITGPAGSGRSLTARTLHAASPASEPPPPWIDLRDGIDRGQFGDGAATVMLRYPDRLDAVAQSRLVDWLAPGMRCIAVADSTAPLVPALRRRIATVEIAVPPLRDRPGDAVLLARHFAREAGNRFGRPAAPLTAAAEAAVAATLWPDEVRGLALAIERAVLLADGRPIDAAALVLPARPPEPAAAGSAFDLLDAERALIDAALREHHHNVTRAAAALGLSRGALYRRMARHGL